MSSRTKYQDNSFVKHTVLSRNIKIMFLSQELMIFSKILLCGKQIRHGKSLFVSCFMIVGRIYYQDKHAKTLEMDADNVVQLFSLLNKNYNYNKSV